MTLSWTFSAVTLVQRVRWSQEHFILSNYYYLDPNFFSLSITRTTPEHCAIGLPMFLPSVPSTASESQCSLCQVTFANRQEQVGHYRLDWHRCNLQRSLAGKPSLTEEQFLQDLSNYFFSVLKSYIFFLHRVTHFPIYRVIYFSFFRAVYFLFLKVIIFLCYALVYFPLCRPGGFKVDEHVFSFHFMNIIMV